MTATDITLDTIEHLDFAPPCECRQGECPNSAEWLGKSKPPFCQCVTRWIACDQCLHDMRTSRVVIRVTCILCGKQGVASSSECIQSVEPLRKSTP